MNTDLTPLIHVMNTVHGFDIHQFNPAFVEKSLEHRFTTTSTRSYEDYLAYMVLHPGEAEEFYSSLFVSYSDFFRNSLTFGLLEHLILPRLIEQKQKSGQAEIRVWSAGCSGGQECYSLAILLDELITACGTPVSYRVFATDISESELERGRKGVYDSMAIQNVRLKHIASYFESNQGAWLVSPRLKDRVEFSSYDLLDEHSVCPPGSIFGDFDLIFCCNLLFYYQPRAQQFILHKIHHALAEGGYLVSGETEGEIIEKTVLFSEICSPSAIFSKKLMRGYV